jgi:hypothetical protein
MKDRFDRLKGRFSDLDDVLGEAMDLLAPRSLSVSASRQRSRRENDMPRYSPASSKASRAPVFAGFSPFIGQPFGMIQRFD